MAGTPAEYMVKLKALEEVFQALLKRENTRQRDGKAIFIFGEGE